LMLAGKTVLVTGAGGSIGSELCRQIARSGPAQLLLLGHGENSIYHIHQELVAREPAIDLVPLIADTRDAGRLATIFDRFRPDVVVHAAAHKHVPLMQWNPEEAVSNNVEGTKVLVETCERSNVQTFVMISTDKAVNPTSVMGATKRIAEHIVQAAAARTGRRYVAVRFGNVLGSRGSVVPLFQRQIEAGGPVTVTHPDVRRYFMTIPEAVQLVLQSAALGRGGEVFVLDMGEPVRIVDLARDMIRLAGLEVGEDIEIAFTGLRPGEKLYEELFFDDEHHARTVHEKVFVSRNGHGPGCPLDTALDCLLDAAQSQDRAALYACIRDLVPECADTLGEQI
jgi:FlaA1/EpsC-like NDP-sugar epimerase